MSDSFTAAPDDLALALTETLHSAFETFPQLVLDAEQLASKLAPEFSVRLAEAAVAAGVPAPALARALADRSEASGPGANAPLAAGGRTLLAGSLTRPWARHP